MYLVDWHTQLAGRDRRKAHVPMGYVPRRMSRSCSVVHDVLAGTCDDITAEVGQADRNECREPRGKAFRRLAEISYGPSRTCRFTRTIRYAEEVSDDFASLFADRTAKPSSPRE